MDGTGTCGIPVGKIKDVIASAQGKVSVYFRDLSGKQVFEHESSVRIPSASLIKVPILMRLFMDAAHNGLDLNQAVPLKPQNRVGGSGVLDLFPEDTSLPLEVLARLMIVLSDNCATNEIIDKIGIGRIQEFIESMGLKETSIQRKMMDFEAIKQGKNNYTSARDMGNLLVHLGESKFGDAFSKKVLGVMKRQQVRHLLPLLIPAVASDKTVEEMTLPPPGAVLVANKTGDLGDKLHDAGWFLLPDGREYVLVVMTYDLPALSDGMTPITEISRLVYWGMTEGRG